MADLQDTPHGATPLSAQPTPTNMLRGRRELGAILLLIAAVLLLVGLAFPWRIVTPLNDAAASLIGNSGDVQRPISLFSSPSLTALFSGMLCFPLAPVLASALLSIAGISSVVRGRPTVPLDLVVASCVIGFTFIAPLLFLLGPVGFSHQAPQFAITYTWGLWITLISYLAAFIGCFLLRHRRPRRTPERLRHVSER